MKIARYAIIGIALAVGSAAGVAIDRSQGTPPATEVRASKPVVTEVGDRLMAAYALDTKGSIGDRRNKLQPWPKANVAGGMVHNGPEAEGSGSTNGPANQAELLMAENTRQDKVIKGPDPGFVSAILPSDYRATLIDSHGAGTSGAGGFILPEDRFDTMSAIRNDMGNETQNGYREGTIPVIQAATQSTIDSFNIVRSDDSITRRINMGIGESVIVDLPRDASEVLVGSPSVANAVVRSSRRLYILAIGSGQTTIFAMDAQDHRIATIDILIGRDIAALDRILKLAIPGSNIVLRTVSDTIILTGEVDSAGDAQKALDIAGGFVSRANAPVGGGAAAAGGASVSITSAAPASADGKVINSLVIRGQDQVMLKVTVAEIQRQVAKQLGITSSYATGDWGSFTQQNGLPLAIQKLTTGATTFASRGSLSATLTAFERAGVARVLAEPTVTAVSGESAKFTAGGQIPTPQNETCPPPGTAGSCSISVTYMNYGVTLNFTPVVLSGGHILLHVATEVTEVDPQQSVQFQNINVPGFRTRKNETSVELPSGGSIVSAGLIQVQSQQVISGLPGMMDLPILGQLFRSRDYQRQETELMIVVTPYIAKPVGPNEVARPDDGFADASDPQTALLGRVNRVYANHDNPDVIKNFKGRVGFIDD